jgi:hypothetical protein
MVSQEDKTRRVVKQTKKLTEEASALGFNPIHEAFFPRNLLCKIIAQ